MRTLNTTLIRVEPFATVAPACPSLRENSALTRSALVRNSALVENFAAAQNPVSKLRSLVFSESMRSWPAAAAASSAAVTARPQGRVEATGVGYAAPAAAETRLGADGIGTGINGTNGKQQDQLHLMSRRDPRSWRPPA